MHVLEHEADDQKHHQPGGRLPRSETGDERLDQPVDEGLQLGGPGPQAPGGSEQVLQQRDQHDQGEAIEQGSQHGGHAARARAGAR